MDLNEFAQLCLDSPSLMGLDVTEEEEEEVVAVEINQCVRHPSSGENRHTPSSKRRVDGVGRRERAVNFDLHQVVGEKRRTTAGSPKKKALVKLPPFVPVIKKRKK